MNATIEYRKRSHILCWNNCHNFVAEALNNLGFEGKSNYGMHHVWWMCLRRSVYYN